MLGGQISVENCFAKAGKDVHLTYGFHRCMTCVPNGGCEHSLTAYLPPKTGRSIGLEQNAVHLFHFVKVWLRGDTNRACVCDGNFQVEVTGLCMFISMVLSCIPVLEQPLGSCMPHVPMLRNLFSWFGMVKTVAYMGCFSGPSVKPLQIWHPPNTLEGLCRQKPSHWDFDSQLASRGHDGCYTGVRGLCQESEAYTPAFGLAVAELYGRVRA